MPDHGHFSSCEKSGERAMFMGIFQGCAGLWMAGCRLVHRLHQLEAPTTMDPSISIFLILYDAWP